MSKATGTPLQLVSDHELAESIILRIATDLSMVVDRSIEVGEIETNRVQRRIAGPDQVHISFKLDFSTGEDELHGCALIPLPDAICLAHFLMIVPDEEVRERRNDAVLDGITKDAVLEVGNFIGGSVDAVIRSLFPPGFTARSAGCQGVRADVRPAFPYTEGRPLVVARAQTNLHDFPPFELILMLPVLPGME